MKFMISEAFWLSGHRLEASERCANAQCSNNLQRGGFSLSSNTPSRKEGREGSEQFRRKIGDKLNRGAKSYRSFGFLVKVSPSDRFERDFLKVSRRLKHSGYDFSVAEV